MSHHDSYKNKYEGIELHDSAMAARLRTWEGEMTREDFRARVREAMDDLQGARGWIGRDGDDANDLYNVLKDVFLDDDLGT